MHSSMERPRLAGEVRARGHGWRAVLPPIRAGLAVATVASLVSCGTEGGVLDDPCFGAAPFFVDPGMATLAVGDTVSLTTRENPAFGCTLVFDFAWDVRPPELVEVEKTSPTTARAIGRQPGEALVKATSPGGRAESITVRLTVQ